MTTATQDPVSLAFAPAPHPRRLRQHLIGSSFAIVGVLLYFATLFGIYLTERSSFRAANPDESWIPAAANIQLTAPTVMFWTLLLSIFTMQWAVYSAKREDRRHMLLAVVVTALFGLAVINQMAFVFIQMELAIDGGSLAAPLIYTLCGSFIALVVTALAFLILAAFRGLSGRSLRHNTELMSAAALYWHTMTFIYMVLWIAVFIAK